jgi:nitroreductase
MKYETNYAVDFQLRNPLEGVDDLFSKRWSPRSFKKSEIDETVLTTIFDAARWAPSCFNEQPWLFITSSGETDFDLFLKLLSERNQRWAVNASVIGFILAKRHFNHNGKPNRFAAFDCGAAWLAMSLQANLHGLYTHGIGGIKNDEVYQTFHVSEEHYEVLCGFAIGVIDSPERLSDDFIDNEIPSARKPLRDMWIHVK